MSKVDVACHRKGEMLNKAQQIVEVPLQLLAHSLQAVCHAWDVQRVLGQELFYLTKRRPMVGGFSQMKRLTWRKGISHSRMV